MMYHLVKVSAQDWAAAKAFFKTNPTKTHMKKVVNGTPMSFDMINGVIYAEGDILGQGGFGKVKIAQNEKGECYAIKIQKIINGLTVWIDQEIEILKHMDQFEGEMQRTWYQNPAQPQPDYKDGMKRCVLMHLLEGDRLDKVIAKANPSETQRLLVALQSAVELRKIHQKNVIHADIKSLNMNATIVGQKITIEIFDFGLAKVAPTGKVTTGTTEGTEGYRAPEIEAYGDFSFASDVFALGYMFRMDLDLLQASVSGNGLLANMRDMDPAKRLTLDQVINILIKELEKRADLNADGHQIVRDAKTPNLVKLGTYIVTPKMAPKLAAIRAAFENPPQAKPDAAPAAPKFAAIRAAFENPAAIKPAVVPAAPKPAAVAPKPAVVAPKPAAVAPKPAAVAPKPAANAADVKLIVNQFENKPQQPYLKQHVAQQPKYILPAENFAKNAQNPAFDLVQELKNVQLKKGGGKI